MGVARTTTQTARRWRWRMRGAWLWPSFALLTVADALLIDAQPLSGTDTGLVPALLLAGFANLLVLATLVPLLARRLRRRDRSLPVVVAKDRAAVWLFAGVTAVFFALGLAHRDGAQAQRDEFHAQSQAVRAYVAHNGAAVYRRNIDRADSVHPGPGFYRTCVPGDPGGRPLCLLVNTDQSPPGIRVDPSRETNAELFGDDNPGRSAP